jgi:predicted ATPase
VSNVNVTSAAGTPRRAPGTRGGANGVGRTNLYRALELLRASATGRLSHEHPQRTFEAIELSDGTLRYLALVGALLAYRLPAFIALNEPEASLHPDLLEPLARLIVRASQRTQVWLVTHSLALADALAEQTGLRSRTVVNTDGKTWVEGLTIGGEFDDR